MKVVFSGVNIFSGGTLNVYRETLKDVVDQHLDENNTVIAFVFKKELFSDIQGKIEFIEVPFARKSYFHRICFEFVYLKKWSKDKNVDLWIAMHDLSPNVIAKKKYTYFHSAQIFYRMPKNKIKYDLRTFAFSKLYKYFISINSKKIDGYIVQADWIQYNMEKMFSPKSVVVIPPNTPMVESMDINKGFCKDDIIRFIYPAYPRVFKNFEVIGEASRVLNQYDLKYEILFTIDGTENAYSRMLYKHFSNDRHIIWLGIQDYKELQMKYMNSDVLIFPSELETWGLPITEMIHYRKRIIAIDLPYAHETASDYDDIVYFDSTQALADEMRRIIEKGKKQCSSGLKKYFERERVCLLKELIDK